MGGLCKVGVVSAINIFRLYTYSRFLFKDILSFDSSSFYIDTHNSLMAMSAPTIDISQYEVSIVKQAWLALNLFQNYHKLNSSSKNGGPKLINNEFQLHEFQQGLATKIYEKLTTKDSDSSSFISGTNVFDNDLFGSNQPTSLTDSEIDEIVNDYQIEPLLQFITIMINYLEFNMIQPGESMINLSKKNVRLYGMSSTNYQLFGECLIQAMVDKLSITDASKFQGEEQFIFNKFLSQVLSFLVCYSKESTVTLPNDASSSTTRNNEKPPVPEKDAVNYPVPTISDTLNVVTPYSQLTQPVKPLTRSSSTSLPSEKSSQISLNHHRNNDESFDHVSQNENENDDINWKHNSPSWELGKNDMKEEVIEDGELVLARSSSNESITEPFDYLNSFRCYKTPIEQSSYAKLKRSFSGVSTRDSSSSSSGKKWSIFNKRGTDQLQKNNTHDQTIEKQNSRNRLYRIISRR
ncbi:hypothetical protein CORT_0A11450 [Candida orthopsilosis Co 90-125]|uniref:Uncharacterized protein n=1 Tax=Candida orthopsilosis (strain 90-125) TaxID=1136231 RepID=H8WYP8_CANO9|nr:hypothetical protein CORT_0A11450 [Candida orthopsilosis Co 90-125]CCG21530.1 hypothetical protein CORT_0A11450 [Candida orthopsilosis Co 90-125]